MFNSILLFLSIIVNMTTIWYTIAMCGRYGFSVKDAKEVYERFDTYNELADLTARYNVAPGQMNPVMTSHSPNEISRMFWGLIPHWAKDDSISLIRSMRGLRPSRKLRDLPRTVQLYPVYRAGDRLL